MKILGYFLGDLSDGLDQPAQSRALSKMFFLNGLSCSGSIYNQFFTDCTHNGNVLTVKPTL